MGIECIRIYKHPFRLAFPSSSIFFASLSDDEKSHFVRFSSESCKKYRRYFQPVCGEMDDNKLLFTDT